MDFTVVCTGIVIVGAGDSEYHVTFEVLKPPHPDVARWEHASQRLGLVVKDKNMFEVGRKYLLCMGRLPLE